MFNYLVLLVAIALSAVAAYYSVVGLAYIFSAAVIPIVVMGSVLELSKLVAASWLYRNWSIAPLAIKYYLITAVTILIFITSMGIFGFLSKAHLDQSSPTGDVVAQIEFIQERISIEQEKITSSRNSLRLLDEQVSRFTELGAVSRGVSVRQSQQEERQLLLKTIQSAQSEIISLRETQAPLSQQLRQVEAKVGPIKYIAALIYGDNTSAELLEKAVRVVIITLVFVFDPLAVILLLAANISLKNQPKPKKSYYKPKENKQPLWALKAAKLKEKKKRGIVEIDKNSIVEMK